jgi:hypothetical protein
MARDFIERIEIFFEADFRRTQRIRDLGLDFDLKYAEELYKLIPNRIEWDCLIDLKDYMVMLLEARRGGSNPITKVNYEYVEGLDQEEEDMIEEEEDEEEEVISVIPVVPIANSVSEVVRNLTFDPMRETWEEHLEKERVFREKCEESDRERKEFLLRSFLDENWKREYVSTDEKINHQVDEEDFNILFDKEIFDETFRKFGFRGTDKELRMYIEDEVPRDESKIEAQRKVPGNLKGRFQEFKDDIKDTDKIIQKVWLDIGDKGLKFVDGRL